MSISNIDNSDKGNLALLVILNVTGAVDTVDHNVIQQNKL